jgi:peptide chain release factor 1
VFNKLDQVVVRYDELNILLTKAEVYESSSELIKVTTEKSNIEDIVETYKVYKKTVDSLEEAKELLKSESDEEIREMAKEELTLCETDIEDLKEKLKVLLLPKDPLDNKNVIVEIRAGAGGDEASIFVADILRMYQNYFKGLGFKVELVSMSRSDDGIKEVIINVSGEKVYSKLKYESGVHRVQRVPKTESQGRVHTSTITVAVLPEPNAVEFELDMNDVRVDVYRSGGCGGQSVNTTDSAVRVTHLPTNTVVAIQDEKSQIKNKAKALKILTSRIYDKMVQEADKKEADTRKGMVGKGDRSERIRTYNFPQGRLSDHRIGLTIYNLEKIIDGELGEVTHALIAYNQAELLKGQNEEE